MTAIVRLLITARDTWKNTPPNMEKAITADHWAKLDDANQESFLNKLLREADEADIALAVQTPITARLSQVVERLTLFVSHFHQVLDLAILRGIFKPGVRSFYGRDVSATTLPDLSTYKAVEEAAQKVIAGDQLREEASDLPWIPMAMPSVAEVQAVLAQYQTARDESQQAQRTTDREREDLSALYDEAYALAVDICDTVEFFYRKDPDASSRRAKCVRWGVVYVYGPSETPETPPVAPAVTTTPAKA
jgi:hypothetical protein